MSDLAPIKIDGHYGYVKKSSVNYNDSSCNARNNSQELHPTQGWAEVMLQGRRITIKRPHTLAIPAKFDSALPFLNGFGLVKINNRWSYIDKSGELHLTGPDVKLTVQSHNCFKKKSR